MDRWVSGLQSLQQGPELTAQVGPRCDGRQRATGPKRVRSWRGLAPGDGQEVVGARGGSWAGMASAYPRCLSPGRRSWGVGAGSCWGQAPWIWRPDGSGRGAGEVK